MLKHYGKKEVLCLINQMEDCFNCPFKFDPEAIEPARKARGASAVEHGLWGYGIKVYGKRMEIPAQGNREEHPQCSDVWVLV